MPYKPADAPRHDKDARTAKQKRQWAHIANDALKRGDSEGVAIRKANGVVDDVEVSLLDRIVEGRSGASLFDRIVGESKAPSLYDLVLGQSLFDALTYVEPRGFMGARPIGAGSARRASKGSAVKRTTGKRKKQPTAPTGMVQVKPKKPEGIRPASDFRKK